MEQQAIHFVGLDVHQSTVVASVRDESGTVVMKATVPTEEKAIVALVRNLSWPRVRVAFEEGTQAQWLHDVLTAQVERVVVCNVRGKSPLANKDDRIDADAMSEGLPVGALTQGDLPRCSGDADAQGGSSGTIPTWSRTRRGSSSNQGDLPGPSDSHSGCIGVSANATEGVPAKLRDHGIAKFPISHTASVSL